MEKLIRIDQKIVNKGDPNSLPKIIKWAGCSREYFIDGHWTTEKPSKKPEGTRIVFPSLEQFRIAKDVYFAWDNIISQQIAPPEHPDTILERLIQARRANRAATLFIPWGVRPKGVFGNSETKALEIIEKLKKNLAERNISTQILIMPADIYATEINNQVDPYQARTYFQAVTEETLARGFEVKPWSMIRADNQDKYDKIYSQKDPERLLPTGILDRALKAAKCRSGYQGEKDIESAALAYLRERVCEAEIIENVYEPIKISMVAKGKDAYVDGNLPRVYILPKELQFPWLKQHEK